ncbi:MAG: amidase [Deltaproteobacteria bacterium]|nr:amidase [Deltaproteobacteria bacterium]
MASEDLCWLSAAETAAAIKRKKVSPVEVLRAVLAQIERLNPTLNAFVTVTAEHALKEARAAERALMRKNAIIGPFHGVPFSTKDVVNTKGIRTTFGTPLYAENVPTEDAPIVARLRAAGAIQLGKTNTPTFGWLGVTHNLLFGTTRSPWNTECTPGGSSGGAGAAVAAGMGPLAIGTDAGGSIRIPASFSGIYGLKPSFGRIPVYPPSAAWSISHLGPMTRTVTDAALLLTVCAGPDHRDQYSLPAEKMDYVKALRGSLKGLRVAWTADLGFTKAIDPEVKAACEKAAKRFREFGCRVEEVKPNWPSPQEAWEVIFSGSLATRLAPSLADRRADLEPGLAALIDRALTWGPTRYIQAWFDRLAWNEPVQRLFEKYALLLTPTLPCRPFAVGLDHPTEVAGTPVDRYEWIPFTFPFNLTGNPAASVPCGFTADGLPVGLQTVGRRFDDLTVLRASAACEQARPWVADRKSGLSMPHGWARCASGSPTSSSWMARASMPSATGSSCCATTPRSCCQGA